MASFNWPSNSVSVASLAIGTPVTGGTNNYLLYIDGSGNLGAEAVATIAQGGTGQATAQAARNALLPSQGPNSGKFLTTNGTDVSWATVSAGSSIAIGSSVTSGTAGSILYVDGSSQLAQDNTHFYFDDTSLRKRLGINIGTSPKYHLQIGGDATVPSAGLYSALATANGTADGILLNSASTQSVGMLWSGSSSGSSPNNFYGASTKGTPSSPTAVATGETPLRIGAYGYDGTNMVPGSKILWTVNGSVSSNVVPIDMIFYADDSVDTETLRISRTGASTAGTITAAGFTSSGIVHNSSSGVLSSSLLVNADISASAAIAYSKLNTLSTGQIVLGNAGVATATTLTGDVTVGATGVTAIGSGAITNAKVSASAAIDYSKLNLSASILNADISASAAIAYSKLASMSTGQVLLGNAGTPTATTLSGDVTVGATGVTAIGATKVTNAMLAGSIDLATKMTGLLPMANGGSNKNMTPVAGGVVWTDADSMEVTAAGTAGQTLVSTGTTAPSWSFGTIQTKSANYTLLTSDTGAVGNTAGGAITLTLPTAVGAAGMKFTIAKGDTSANLLTIASTSSQTLGLGGPTSMVLHRQGETLIFTSDGANWLIDQNYRTETATISASASSSITSQSGAWLASVGNVSSGNALLTFVTGIFSVAPIVYVSGNLQDDTFVGKLNGAATTTAVTMRCWNSGTNADASSWTNTVIAVGPR